ncbi:MAG: hypothetical protein ACRECH_10755 [Nitrososphaerales archaeon]
MGTFLDVQKGKVYADLYILLAKDFVENKMRIQSLPVALVKRINVFKEKPRKKGLMTFHKRKMVVHFKDGSVKYVGSL